MSSKVDSFKLKGKSLSWATMLVFVLILTGCQPKHDEYSVLWGKTDTYDKFLWKEQIPDTLKQTLCFDFNDDARQYLSSPLRIGVFKKTEHGHLTPVPTSEAQLFVEGKAQENNILTVQPTESEKEVGIVFSPNAENKMHYWYLKPVDTAGLDRINDQAQYGADDALMEIKLRKRHVMNPLAEGLMWFGMIVGAALVLWFLILKRMFFPVFRVTRLQLTGPEPYMSLLKLKNYRLCILSAHPEKQSALNRLFCGEIKYEVNPMWTAPVVFEPRDKKSIRVRPDKNTYSTDARIMKTNADYVLVNELSKAKTNMRIS